MMSKLFRPLYCTVRGLLDPPKYQLGNQERGLVDRKLVQALSNCIPGRPKAALLFWFFGDFRCGVLLFMVILVVYKYKSR